MRQWGAVSFLFSLEIMTLQRLYFFSFLFFVGSSSLAQCPTNEADLADGGSFSGTCNIAVGTEIVIAGVVDWNSGTLSITGNDGDIDVSGTLNILGGTVRAINNNDGNLNVLSSGSINVSNGATLTIYEEILVLSGGTMNISGTVTSTTREFDIDNGGSVTVTSTGSIATGGNLDVLVQGTLVNAGIIDSDDDVVVSGTGSVTNSGSILSDDDMIFGGTLVNSGTIDPSGDATISGTATNSGTFGDASINNLTVSGTLTNTGTIDGGAELFISGTVTSSGSISTSADIFVSGAASSLTINAPGTALAGDDLKVDDGGTVTIDLGATITVTQNVVNAATGTGGSPSQGTIIVDGDLIAGGNLTIFDTTPDSGLLGSGTVTTTGTFTDNEAGPYSTCGGGGVPCDPVPLPVKLIHFSGAVLDGDAVLVWTTGEEVNNEGFYVEKSLDAVHFEPIGFVNGSGTTIEKRNYSFTDKSLSSEAYYRIKQVDYDGAFEYFKIIHLYASVNQNLLIFPNPSTGNVINLLVHGLDSDSALQITIFDNTGTVIHNQKSSGSISQIELPNIAVNGVYVVKIDTGVESLMERLIINR